MNLLYILVLLGACGVGALLTLIFVETRIIGNLRIDHSDPTNKSPYFFLEINSSKVTDLDTKKFVVLKVLRKDFVQRTPK